MRLGIDFDNTIVCYDDVFHKAATLQSLIPNDLPPSKNSVRDYLRAVGKEEDWTRLQGTVYGARMDLANPFAGVAEFFRLCDAKRISACIISHKTRFPYLGPQYDLHEAAKQWLARQNFPWTPLAYFELTLSQKLARIAHEGCSHFIDDLPELLLEPSFPPNVKKILFDPNRAHPEGPYERLSSWKEIIERLTHDH